MSKSDNGDVVKIEEELAIVQFNGLLMDANLLKEKAASCKFFVSTKLLIICNLY